MRVPNGVPEWSKVRVEIVEYDRFSGPSVFDRMEFDDVLQASRFVAEHNYKEGIGSGAEAPDTYYVARIV